MNEQKSLSLLQRTVAAAVFSVSTLLLLPACSIYHVDSEDVTTNFYPAKQSSQDVVYVEKVDKPHEILGYVNVNTERSQYLSEILEKMKREAAVLGGDAITDMRSDATGVWKSLPAQELIGNAYVRSNYSATVIKFK